MRGNPIPPPQAIPFLGTSRARLTAALAVTAASVAVFTRFLAWAQTRPGVILDDAILRRLLPADCSTPIFIVLYAVILWTVFQVLRDLERFISGLYAYSALTWMRLATIFLFPLAPPEGMISLRDPFVRSFFDGKEITKDLFFSGHIATAVLMILLVRGTRTRIVFSAAAVVVAAMILVQHAHYTIDVAAAPLFGWLAFRFGRRIAA
jgi:hypothetical protein